MAKYPIILEMADRRAIIIGGGAVAVRKARALIEAGARLVIVSERADDVLTTLCRDNKVELIKSRYTKDYLSGAVLVIAATNNLKLNSQIYHDCQRLDILCNVVDQPGLCDFFLPAVVKRGRLQLTVSTDGDCPAYAGHLRKKLERIFTDKHGEFLAELKKLREQILEDEPDISRRKSLLGQLVDDQSFEYFTQNGPAKWHSRAEEIIKEHEAET